MSVNQDIEKSKLPKRQSLIVHLTKVSAHYKLRRYGDIVYFSKKLHYCILYVDSSEAKKIAQKIGRLKFVSGVELSQRDQIDLNSDHIQKQIEDMAAAAEKKLLQRQKHGEINENHRG